MHVEGQTCLWAEHFTYIHTYIHTIIYFDYSFIHYLSLTSPFTYLTPPGPYRAMTWRERINSGSHTYFLTTQGLGGPLRMRDQLNAGAISETTQTWKRIHTIHAPILPNKIWKDDYDGQMIFGTLWALTFLTIALQVRKNPGKNLTQETCPDRGSNPGPLQDKCACYHSLHSGGQRPVWFGRNINFRFVLSVYVLATLTHGPDDALVCHR